MATAVAPGPPAGPPSQPNSPRAPGPGPGPGNQIYTMKSLVDMALGVPGKEIIINWNVLRMLFHSIIDELGLTQKVCNLSNEDRMAIQKGVGQMGPMMTASGQPMPGAPMMQNGQMVPPQFAGRMPGPQMPGPQMPGPQMRMPIPMPPGMQPGYRPPMPGAAQTQDGAAQTYPQAMPAGTPPGSPMANTGQNVQGNQGQLGLQAGQQPGQQMVTSTGTQQGYPPQPGQQMQGNQGYPPQPGQPMQGGQYPPQPGQQMQGGQYPPQPGQTMQGQYPPQPGQQMQSGQYPPQPGQPMQGVTPPGQQMQGVTPPGQQMQAGTPPGQQGVTPPGQQGVTPPGQQGVTPPGQPMQGSTPPGQKMQGGQPLPYPPQPGQQMQGQGPYPPGQQMQGYPPQPGQGMQGGQGYYPPQQGYGMPYPGPQGGQGYPPGYRMPYPQQGYPMGPGYQMPPPGYRMPHPHGPQGYLRATPSQASMADQGGYRMAGSYLRLSHPSGHHHRGPRYGPGQHPQIIKSGKSVGSNHRSAKALGKMPGTVKLQESYRQLPPIKFHDGSLQQIPQESFMDLPPLSPPEDKASKGSHAAPSHEDSDQQTHVQHHHAQQQTQLQIFPLQSEEIENMLELIAANKEKIEKMEEALENVETGMVSKETMDEALNNKVDKGHINTKVSYDEFGTAIEELHETLREVMARGFNSQEQWGTAIEELSKLVRDKLDRADIIPLKAFVKSNLKALDEKVRKLQALFEAPDPAGTRKKLLRGYNCISCDRHCTISGQTNGPKLPTIGPIPAGHVTASRRAFELHKMRTEKRFDRDCRDLVMMERQMRSMGLLNPDGTVKDPSDDMVNRYHGGSHTAVTNAALIKATRGSQEKRPSKTSLEEEEDEFESYLEDMNANLEIPGEGEEDITVLQKIDDYGVDEEEGSEGMDEGEEGEDEEEGLEESLMKVEIEYVQEE